MPKLNHSGLAHFAVPLLVMVLIAVGGTYLIVASHAMSANGGTSSSKTKTPGGSRQRIVEVARSQLGYKETPSNIFKYWKKVERPKSEEWCSDFATWVWHAAGVDLNGQAYPRQSYVGDVVKTAGSRYHSGDPKPGDAIIYGGDRHIGIVERVSGNHVTTIEGNAGPGDTAVIRRSISNWQKPTNVPYPITGFVTPPGV